MATTMNEMGDTRQEMQKYLDVLQKSGLVDQADLVRALKEFRASTKNTPDLRQDVTALGQFLVDAALLTRWQQSMLSEGRHKGFRLGKYQLLAELGAGGMSTVYLAEHKAMRRRVALKVLHPTRVDQRTFLPRFLREARAIAALDHANIVRVYDVDNEDKTFYMAMEYVEGVDLQKRVKLKGPLSAQAAAYCVRQAAEGLVHAHERGIIHRDIKPSNLLVDRNNGVKILDLGLVQLTGEERALTIEHNERVLGTADYLAPEQAVDSHHVDHRVDIYSLGCTLYYLLTGSPPFTEGTVVERLLKHQNEKPKSILSYRPDAPASLVAICEKMMAKRPSQRYQTAAEVSQALKDWAKESRRPSSSVPTAEPLDEPAEMEGAMVDLFPDVSAAARKGRLPGNSRAVGRNEADVHNFLSAMSGASHKMVPQTNAYSPTMRTREPTSSLQFWLTIGMVGFVLALLGFVVYVLQG